MNRSTLFATALAVIAIGLAGIPLLTSGGTLGITNFDSITLSDDLIVGDDLTVTDDVTLTAGDLALTAGSLSIGGELDLDGTDFLNLTPATTLVATAGASLTPLGTMQPITSASSVALSTTLSIATSGFEAGDLVILQNNNAADTITVDGTGGSVNCKADVILGAADTLTIFFDGTQWECLSGYDNS